MTTPEEQEAARRIVRDMVSTSVREAMDSLAEELRQEVSRHVDTRVRDASQRQDPPHYSAGASSSGMSQGRFDINPYLGMGSQTQRDELGASRVLGGWSGGLTPSGDGSIPPGLTLPGLQTFQLDQSGSPASLSSSLRDVPLSTFAPAVGGPAVAGGVIVGHLSPPVPMKLAWKIWRGEFVDLNLLLPHRLGAPEPTLADALQNKTKEQKQIEHWIICFNAYISVMALHYPGRVRDLLAYSSIITKAAHDYEGTPWLSYDTHFRTLAASMHLQTWGHVDQSLWFQTFNRATWRQTNQGALAIGPYMSQPQDAKPGTVPGKVAKGKSKEIVTPYTRQQPICIKWNRDGCRSAQCTYRHICLSCHGLHREPDCTMQRRERESSGGKPPFRRDQQN